MLEANTIPSCPPVSLGPGPLHGLYKETVCAFVSPQTSSNLIIPHLHVSTRLSYRALRLPPRSPSFDLQSVHKRSIVFNQHDPGPKPNPQKAKAQQSALATCDQPPTPDRSLHPEPLTIQGSTVGAIPQVQHLHGNCQCSSSRERNRHRYVVLSPIPLSLRPSFLTSILQQDSTMTMTVRIVSLTSLL